jgi:FkbM family methyltransferase
MREYTTEGVPEYVQTLFHPGFVGICVDIGAFDPLWISNSWLFEQAGWETYCIEPNPNCIPRLKDCRKNVLEYACGSRNQDDVDLFVFRRSENEGEAAGTGLIDHRRNPVSGLWHEQIFSRIDTVKVRTLDWLMEHEIRAEQIDYLSIDVERNEMAVLYGTDLFRWHPKVIVIENIDEDLDQRHHLEAARYLRMHRIGVNDIYVRSPMGGSR